MSCSKIRKCSIKAAVTLPVLNKQVLRSDLKAATSEIMQMFVPTAESSSPHNLYLDLGTSRSLVLMAT